MKRILAVAIAAILSIGAFAQQKAGVISLPQFKLSMSAFSEANYSDNQVILVCYLPGSDKFSPNVNLMKHEYAGTLDSYKLIMEEEFTSMGIPPIQSRIEKDAYIFEYEFENGGLSLHFLTVAKTRDGIVYLVTATATQDQWNTYKAELVRVASSLEFTK